MPGYLRPTAQRRGSSKPGSVTAAQRTVASVRSSKPLMKGAKTAPECPGGAAGHSGASARIRASRADDRLRSITLRTAVLVAVGAQSRHARPNGMCALSIISYGVDALRLDVADLCPSPVESSCAAADITDYRPGMRRTYPDSAGVAARIGRN